jgi:ADP-ribose pyrophosphatase YjhB (NUDIX family)
MLDGGGLTRLRSTGFSPQFARIIVLRAGTPAPEILLVWYANGDHQLPGGKWERTESLRVCVLRELLEETGLKLHPDQLTYLRAAALVHPAMRECHLGHYYLVIYSGTTSRVPSPQPGDTVKGAAWFSPHTAHRLKLASGTDERLVWVVAAAGRSWPTGGREGCPIATPLCRLHRLQLAPAPGVIALVRVLSGRTA